MAGYSPEVIRDFVKRFGSIAKAEEEALAVPGFGEEIRRVDDGFFHLSMRVVEPPGMREELEAERRSLVVEALREDGDVERGARLPLELIERAVQLHVGPERMGKGRLSLESDLGLTEWYASQILRWYRRGEPEGLWLDDGRLCWGAAITPVYEQTRPEQGAAPTPSYLRLPRI